MPENRLPTTLMLGAAFAVPLLYFGVQLIAAPFIPDITLRPTQRVCLEQLRLSIQKFLIPVLFSPVSPGSRAHSGYFGVSMGPRHSGFVSLSPSGCFRMEYWR